MKNLYLATIAALGSVATAGNMRVSSINISHHVLP